MALHLGSVVPDFTQDSTEGPIHFHEWIGNHWAILFSHPKDFTPVCTTELGVVSKLKPEFDKRNVKVLALSVDDVNSHKGWMKDIEETQHAKINYPILGDSDRKVSGLYDMIHPEANDTLTVALGVHHRPEQEGAPEHHLPGQHRPQLRRAAAGDRLVAAYQSNYFGSDPSGLEGR